MDINFKLKFFSLRLSIKNKSIINNEKKNYKIFFLVKQMLFLIGKK